MKGLKKAFRYGILFCLLCYYTDALAQTNGKTVIDTLYIEKKLYALMDAEKNKNTELVNEQYRVLEFHITQFLDSISNDYLFFEGYKAFEFKGKATYMMAVYCVWDIKNRKFIDTIDYVNFNKIVNTNNRNLNCYDKAILYELLTFRQLEGIFAHSLKRKKKYQIIHENKFDLNSDISGWYFLYHHINIDLTCNKEIYSLINSSTNQVLYLPRVTLSDDGRRKVKDFFIQVFYFNEGGELVNTMLLEKFMTLKPCD